MLYNDGHFARIRAGKVDSSRLTPQHFVFSVSDFSVALALHCRQTAPAYPSSSDCEMRGFRIPSGRKEGRKEGRLPEKSFIKVFSTGAHLLKSCEAEVTNQAHKYAGKSAYFFLYDAPRRGILCGMVLCNTQKLAACGYGLCPSLVKLNFALNKTQFHKAVYLRF